jgi:hypothetical protein
VYFYLHMGFCMISWRNLLAQRKDFEEQWMYMPDPNRAVDVRHHMADYNSKWMWTCYRRSTQHALEIESHGPLNQHMAGSYMLQRLIYTKQTMYDMLQMLDQSHLIQCHCQKYTIVFPRHQRDVATIKYPRGLASSPFSWW